MDVNGRTDGQADGLFSTGEFLRGIGMYTKDSWMTMAVKFVSEWERLRDEMDESERTRNNAIFLEGLGGCYADEAGQAMVDRIVAVVVGLRKHLGDVKLRKEVDVIKTGCGVSDLLICYVEVFRRCFD